MKTLLISLTIPSLITPAILLSVIGFALLFVFQLLRTSRVIRKKNRKIAHQDHIITSLKAENERQKKLLLTNRKLERAKKTIESKNQSILDSIRYAKKIQTAILPDVQVVAGHFSDSFIFYRPKDIVSGDLYWFKGTKHFTILLVADCTGHGVPGAFMSMISTVLINEMINDLQIYAPDKILNELHIAIRIALRQDTTSNDDGMEVCLCFVEPRPGGKKIIFAGAKRPLYYVKNGVFNQLNADRKSIGGRQKENKRIFNTKTLELYKGDMFYLTTDGYPSQHNEKNEKYGNIAFKNKLLEIASLNCQEQANVLKNFLENYQGNQEQRDDITVIGFRV